MATFTTAAFWAGIAIGSLFAYLLWYLFRALEWKAGQACEQAQARYGYRRGDDDGSFAAALAHVRRWGGVLEHPAHSDAWAPYDLPRPYSGQASRVVAHSRNMSG